MQTALMDFYVEYTLLVSLESPVGRMKVMSGLHGHGASGSSSPSASRRCSGVLTATPADA